MSIKETRLAEYASLVKRIEELEVLKDELKKEITKDFDKNEIQTFSNEHGTYYMVSRKTWYYSDFVKQLEDEVKLRKEKEQKDNIAEYKESLSLGFRPIKE